MSVEVLTFGCRLNFYESELIKKLAINAKLDTLDRDIVVINSCTVTHEAERQLQQTMRRIKKDSPNKYIILVGCAAQVWRDKYSIMPEVSFLLDNKDKVKIEKYKEIADILSKKISTENNVAVRDSDLTQKLLYKSHINNKENEDKVISQINISNLVNNLDIDHCKQQNKNIQKSNTTKFVEHFDHRARAFLKIQDGCDHYCSYCIIPFARGKSISIPPHDIIAQAKKLVFNGHNEIVLTGVDVTSYGYDLKTRIIKLGSLIKLILKEIPSLQRLRLSSLDVAEIDLELFDVIVNEERVMPHLHLSLQSGDDNVLRKMRRRHSVSLVRSFCDRVRKKRSNIAFGADIITGFPEESEEMFKNTCALMEEINIVYLHVFPYSERSGTLAASMQSKIPRSERVERGRALRAIGKKLLANHYSKKVGNTYSAIIEGGNTARMDDFSLAKIIFDNYCNNNIVANIENIAYKQRNVALQEVANIGDIRNISVERHEDCSIFAKLS